MHELNLFKQITRLRKKISINKSRIAAFFRREANVHKCKFHTVFDVQSTESILRKETLPSTAV